MACAKTTIEQYGYIASKPSQTYGTGDVILRIGFGSLHNLSFPF